MSKLLNRAKARLLSSAWNWEQRNSDDAFIDLACFDLHQSIEFALKYLYEINGIVYSKGHNIVSILSDLPSGYTKSSWYSDIYKWSNVINSWETDSRYNDEFSVVSDIYLNVSAKAKELIMDANKNITYVEDLKSRVIRILTILKSDVDLADKIVEVLPNVETSDEQLKSNVIIALKLIKGKD